MASANLPTPYPTPPPLWTYKYQQVGDRMWRWMNISKAGLREMLQIQAIRAITGLPNTSSASLHLQFPSPTQPSTDKYQQVGG